MYKEKQEIKEGDILECPACRGTGMKYHWEKEEEKKPCTTCAGRGTLTYIGSTDDGVGRCYENPSPHYRP